MYQCILPALRLRPPLQLDVGSRRRRYRPRRYLQHPYFLDRLFSCRLLCYRLVSCRLFSCCWRFTGGCFFSCLLSDRFLDRCLFDYRVICCSAVCFFACRLRIRSFVSFLELFVRRRVSAFFVAHFHSPLTDLDPNERKHHLPDDVVNEQDGGHGEYHENDHHRAANEFRPRGPGDLIHFRFDRD